jgi:hypothetical protein
MEQFHCPKSPCALPVHPSPPLPSASMQLLIFLLFLECHIGGIIQYTAFLDWLIS